MGDLVAERLEPVVGELVVARLGLLQGEHVDVAALQQGLDAVDAGADGVDVPGGDAHAADPRERALGCAGMSTALVTGATAGIGLAFAAQLAERGHDLVLVARDRARLENVSDELQRDVQGRRRDPRGGPVGPGRRCGKVADRLADAARPVDLLVNNAGFGMSKSFLGDELADEEADARRALPRGARALARRRAADAGARPRRRSSTCRRSPGSSPMGTYSAAKAWCTAFTEGLASELAGSGVTATALCPGFTHTEFHAARRHRHVAAARTSCGSRPTGWCATASTT